jgi:hypothetical protein
LGLWLLGGNTSRLARETSAVTKTDARRRGFVEGSSCGHRSQEHREEKKAAR